MILETNFWMQTNDFTSVEFLQKLVTNVTFNAILKVKSQSIRNYLNENSLTLAPQWSFVICPNQEKHLEISFPLYCLFQFCPQQSLFKG